MNSRLDTIQAAVLLEKIKIFKDEIVSRNNIADLYRNRRRRFQLRFNLISAIYNMELAL